MSKARTKQAEPAVSPAVQDWLRIASILLCVVGIVVAGYLSWAEVTGKETQCVNAGKVDCKAVQDSAYANTYGMPVALAGLVGYVAILAVLVLEDQVPYLAAYGRTLTIGFTLFGFMFSVYLTLIEATVLDAWCQWCVASAIVVTLLFGIAAYRLYEFWRPLRS